MNIRIGEEAEARIDAIELWWRANRPHAQDLFQTEFGHALDRIAEMPKSWVSAAQSTSRGVRRWAA